jgi:hypothetical protein
VPVDSPTLVTFTLFTSLAPEDLKVEFRPPTATALAPAEAVTAAHPGAGHAAERGFGIGGNRVPSITYYFEIPERGVWDVRVSAAHKDVRLEAPKTPTAPHMYLMVGNESPHTVTSYVTSYASLREGREVTFRAHIYDSNVAASTTTVTAADGTTVHPNTPVPMLVRSANLALVQPDGSEVHLPMRDDGLSSDLGADDGVWGAKFSALETGNYLAEVLVAGVTEDGHAFERSSMHVVPVVRSDVELSAASAHVGETGMVRIAVETTLPSAGITAAQHASGSTTSAKAEADATHRVYAQVYGTSTKAGVKGLVPVAWVSGMADLEALPGVSKLAFQLDLDARWLDRAGATEPLELRNVRVQERAAWVPVATAEVLAVADADRAVVRALAGVAEARRLTQLAPTAVQPITREMREGRNPFATGAAQRYMRERGFAVREGAAAAKSIDTKSKSKSTSKSAVSANGRGGKLLLVHGYCAPASSFPADEFDDAAVFEDLNENRPTDLFARMVMEFGNKYPTFSIFAHSHGGLASTHLHAFYFSNLEVPEGGEKPEGTVQIYTAGSPYQGCAAAGFLASIGGVIGIGCGTNADLTADGAKLWLSGVPPEAQKEVVFYRTQYGTKHLINSCVLASNAVLGNPNDGVIGVAPSVLPHGIDMGVKKEYCHSVDVMNYPGMLTDKERNTVVNENATR